MVLDEKPEVQLEDPCLHHQHSGSLNCLKISVSEIFHLFGFITSFFEASNAQKNENLNFAVKPCRNSETARRPLSVIFERVLSHHSSVSTSSQQWITSPIQERRFETVKSGEDFLCRKLPFLHS